MRPKNTRASVCFLHRRRTDEWPTPRGAKPNAARDCGDDGISAITWSSLMATQLSWGKFCIIGTSHCKHPFQWPNNSIRHTRLNIRMNLLATVRNCKQTITREACQTLGWLLTKEAMSDIYLCTQLSLWVLVLLNVDPFQCLHPNRLLLYNYKSVVISVRKWIYIRKTWGWYFTGTCNIWSEYFHHHCHRGNSQYFFGYINSKETNV